MKLIIQDRMELVKTLSKIIKDILKSGTLANHVVILFIQVYYGSHMDTFSVSTNKMMLH